MPHETKTTLRILNDIDGTDETVEVEADRDELIISLMHAQKIVRRQHKYIRLAVHFRHDLITAHWWADPVIDELLEMLAVPHIATNLLREARIG
jgi:hypothetical protein